MEKVCILYEREMDEVDTEYEGLRDLMFNVNESFTCNRYTLPEKSLIVPRYLDPRDYRDLEMRVYHADGRLVNSYKQHQFVADIRSYHPLIKEWTPAIYSIDYVPNLPEGAYIVKGVTNSDKFKWSTHMFASSKAELIDVVDRILDDGFLDGQALVIRPFVPLKQLGTFQNGLPLSNEWRFFAYKGIVFCGGFYWPQLAEQMKHVPLPEDAIWLAESVAQIIEDEIPFAAIDIAQTAEGNWIVIELNDGCTSGLSCIDPQNFYLDFLDAIVIEDVNETIS